MSALLTLTLMQWNITLNEFSQPINE